MAAVAGVSEASVRRIWREHGIRIAGELEVTAAAASKPEEGTWYPRGIYLYGRERVLVLARMERGALSSAAVEGGHMNVFLRLLLGKTDRLWVDGPRVEFRQFLDRATRTHGDEELIIVVVGTEGARQEALAGISVERAGIRIQELPAHTAWMATLERVLSRLNNANAEGLLVDFVRAIRAYLQDPEEPAMPFVWTWRIETKWPALMTQPLGQSDKLT